MDDSLPLELLLSDFEPLFAERSFLLFERRQDAPRRLHACRERLGESDRGAQALELEFRVESRAQLALATGPGPSGDSAGDWACWSGVELSREP